MERGAESGKDRRGQRTELKEMPVETQSREANITSGQILIQKSIHDKFIQNNLCMVKMMHTHPIAWLKVVRSPFFKLHQWYQLSHFALAAAAPELYGKCH